MKNCIEHSGLLASVLPSFSTAARTKLASHLAGSEIDPQSLTEEDLRLFRMAAEILNCKSLHAVCELDKDCRGHTELSCANHEDVRATAPPMELEENPESARPKEIPPKPKPRGINRIRTQSETVIESKEHTPVRRLASVQSLDIPRSLDRSSHVDSSFMVLVGEANGKTGVVVNRIQNAHLEQQKPNIHQKLVDISKNPQYLKSVCCGYVDDAPFVFFLHVDQKNRVELTAYDVLEDKMKSRASLKTKCELTSMVSVGGLLVCFQRNSNIVQLFHIVKKKWLSPFNLEHPVNLPVLVVHGETVYIFNENTMQRYDVNIGRVTSSYISEYVTSGHGFIYEGRVHLLSDSKRIEYDVTTRTCIRTDFPHLGVRRIHKVFVRNDVVYALTMNEMGKFELCRSTNLEEWTKELSFPKTLDQLMCTVIVDYYSRCPIAPFQTFDESIKRPKFTLDHL